MSGYIFVSVEQKNRQTSSLSASSTTVAVVEASDNMRYFLLDNKTGQAPGNLKTRREHDDLLIEVDGDVVARIEDFYDGPSGSKVVMMDAPGIWTVLASSDAIVGEVSSASESLSWEKESSANDWYLGALGSVVGGALVAFSGKADSSSDSVTLNVSPFAGPFTLDSDNPPTVEVYDADGNLLAQGTIDSSTGQVQFSISGYSGPILVIVTDNNGADADYISEATGEATSLDGSMRAMGTISADGSVNISVTPLTELATQLAGVPDDVVDLQTTALTTNQVATNTSVGELFGISDILGDVVTVVDAGFDQADGLSTAETYGDMLAILSGSEENLGGIQESISALADEISIDGAGEASLSATGASILQDGWLTFEEGTYANTVDTESFVADIPLIVEAQSSMTIDEAADGTIIKVSGVSEGDVIRTNLGATQTDYTVTADMLDGDIASVLITNPTLQNAGDGTHELQVLVNGDALQPVEISLDFSRPTLTIDIADASLASGQATQVTFTFSEAVTGFSNDDISVENGTLSDVFSSDGGTVWQASFIPADGLQNATATIAVGGDYTDVAGNTPTTTLQDGSPVSAQASITIDNSAPTASITLADNFLSSGETTTVTFTFSEAVVDFTLADIELDNASLSNLTSADGGITWTATLTPMEGFEDETNTIRLGKGFSDAAGNAPEAFYQSPNYVLDTASPGITSAADATVDENTNSATVIYTATTDDVSDVVFTVEGTDAGLVNIDSDTGEITLVSAADYETKTTYNLTLVATDSAGNRGEQDLVILVNNLDEIAPSITSPLVASSIDENTGANQSVYQATSHDNDDISAGVTYSLAGTDGDHFSIDAVSGEVTLLDGPDFETQPSYSFDVVATDAAGNTSSRTVTLAIRDVDDTAPVFGSGANVTATAIDENSGANQVVFTAQATDESGSVSYSLSGTDSTAFSINSSTGDVTLLEDPDHETQSSYSFTVTAEDAAGNTSSQNVTLAVNDVDDAAPSITSSTTATAIDENSGAGQVVYTATADDSSDVSGGVTFALGGTDAALFSINASTGAVTLLGDPDYETQSSYSFTVTATDAAGNSSAAQAVTLAVNDLDEIAPVFSSGTSATAVDENGAATVVYTATSDDANATYTLGGTDAAAFSITDGVVTFNGSADYETKSSYTFTITATDTAGNSSDQTVTMVVNDLDDTPPVISSDTTATDVNESGGAVVVYTATSDDPGATYTLGGTDAAAFSIVNGVVTFNGSADYETKSSYTFTVIATDAAGNSSAPQTITMVVNDVDESAPTLTSLNTASAIDENSGAGQVVYTATADDSGDVSGGVTFALGGTDAALFSINASTGAVTLLGNPDHETQSSYSFTVTATDAAGNSSATQTVTLAVNNLDEAAPSITSSATATAIDENSGADQVVYTATADDSSDVSGGVTFALGGTDAALFSIDANTGAVTLLENPNYEVQSSYSFDVTATDAAGNQSSQTVTLAINDVAEVPLAITSSATADDLSENTEVTQAVYTATSSLAGATFSLSAGVDDSDLFSIDASTGVVTLNNPADHETQASYSFTVVASLDGETVDQSVSLTILDQDDSAPVFTNIADLGFVVAWESNGQDGSGTGIYAQRYAADGSVLGDEFRVNTTTASYQQNPVVTMLANGGFVISWESDEQDGSDYGIYAQIYNADGSASGSEFQVNQEGAYNQQYPEITALAGGGFVVVWETTSASEGDNVEGQIYDAAGRPVGDSFALGEVEGINLASYQEYPLVSATSDGGFWLVWSDSSSSLQRYDANGDLVSLSESASLPYSDPDAIATLADDSLVLIYSGYYNSSYGTYSQRIDGTGEAIGNFTTISTTSRSNLDDDPWDISVTALENGGYAVTWVERGYSSGSGSAYTTVNTQIFDTNGAALNSRIELESPLGFFDHSRPSAASTVDGGYLVTWTSYDGTSSDTSVYAVEGQRFDADGNPVGDQFLVNTYTSSYQRYPDVDSWQFDALVVDLDEHSGAGQVVYTVAVADTADEDDSTDTSASVTLQLLGTDAALFSLDAATGQVTLTADPNHETQASYDIVIRATDAAGNQTDQAIQVVINNLDEQAPAFTSSNSVTIDENIGTGQLVHTAVADDSADYSQGVTYSLQATPGSEADLSAFEIDAETGELRLIANPDYETQSSYAVTLVATDAAGFVTTQAFTLNVNDLTELSPLTLSLDENAGANQLVHTATGGESYALTGTHADDFSIDAATGEIRFIDDPNHEYQASYSATVLITDAQGTVTQQQLTLTIQDLDETAPEFSGLGNAEGGYVAAYDSGYARTTRMSENDDLVTSGFTYNSELDKNHQAIGLADGGYIVVSFSDYSGDDNIRAVRVDAHGDQVGDVAVLHTPHDTNDDGSVSDISLFDLMALDDGGFAMVVQETTSAATEDRGLYLYQFDEDMNQQGEAQHIGDANAQYPQLELLPDGTSWLVYKGYEDDGAGNYSYSFYGQRLDADLQPTGELIDLTQLNNSSIYRLSTTTLEDGTLALAWADSTGTGSVYLQTFDTSGSALITAVEVALEISTSYLDMVSLTNGDLVLTWLNDYGFVEAQVVNSQGQLVGEVISNISPALAPSTTSQRYPAVVAQEDGGFVLAWENNADSASLLGRRYDANGNPMGEVFEIDDTAPDYLDLATLRTTRHELDALDENVDAGALVYAAAATDTADIDDTTDTSAGITYALSGTDAAVFSVDAAGNVTLNTSPDYETQSSYEVELTATDAAGNARTLTLVLDINDLGDTAPVFTSDANPTVNENLASGSVVYTPSIDTVADSWSLSGTDSAMFSIDTSTGVVTLADGETLDHETLASYEFVVTATNAFGSTNQTVTLALNDLDEAAPVITSSASVSIDEGSAVNSAVYSATATDAADIDDSTDTSADLVFSINGTDADAFNVDASTGAITLAEVPDYETQTSYSFNLVATDAAGNATSQAVTVSINNIDDTAPTVNSSSTFYVDENAGENKVVGTVTATDVDSDNATITYGIQQGTGDADSFSIDSSTGALTLIPDADYETDSSYYLYVTATDESGNSSSDYVQVRVNDVAENPPTVTSGATATSIEENNGIGEVVYRATADTEVTNFALSGADAGLFTIDDYGYVRTNAVLNHEAQAQYNFTVTLTNEYGSTDQAVTLDLADVDEKAPTITSGAFAEDTQETAELGTTVYTATAVDEADIDDNTQSTSGISYSLGGDDASYFDINGSTGKVSLASGLDYESRQSYSFEVTATDAEGNSSTQQISLTVLDVNEGPVFGSSSSAYIAENAGTDQLVYTASATDADGGSGITYRMGAAGDSALFSIDANTGAVTLSENPDYETQSSYSFTVIAEDASGETAEKTVTLTVNDLAEDAPAFTSGSSVLVNENIANGSQVYSATTDTVADSFSLAGADAALFSINALTGAVSLISSPDHETKSEYQFSVVATNQHGSSQQDITLTVRDLDESVPVFTSGDTASTLTENSGSGQTVYTAAATDTADVDDSTDTSGDLYYSLAEVDDHDYFSINSSTGVVTLNGNPNYEAKPSYSFTVVARDDGGNATSQQVSMVITDLDDTAPQFTSSYYGSVVDGFGASEVVYTATATDSDSLAAPTFSIKSGVGNASLFSIDSTTGELTLLENADLEVRSSYSLTLIATDESGHSSEHDIEIRIADPLEAPPIFTSVASVLQDENTAAGSTVYESDTNVAVDTFSLAGTDASYFSIDASTGEVTLNQALDHESQSTYSFTVVASNAGGVTEHDVTLTLNDVDESAPVYAEPDASVSIDENAAAYQTVYTTQATDTADTDDSTDASTSLIYSLAGDDSAHFSIDGDSGEITFNASADHETQSSYSLTLIATDTGGNTVEQNLTLNINDLDESAPVFTSVATIDDISENTAAGAVIYNATATDTADVDSSANTSSGISYSLTGTDASAFSINANTGAVTINASPDYATQSSYRFTVVAEDAAGNRTEQALALGVIQEDNTAPAFTSGTTATAVDENGAATVVYTATSDDANATYTLSGTDAASFSITDGVVTFNGSADYETQSSYSFTVTAEDAAGNTSTQTVTMAVNDLDESNPVFTTGTTLGNGGFVVTWASSGQDGSNTGIFGQRYDSDGNSVGNEFQINTYTNNSQSSSSVATLIGGGFVVAWSSNGQDGSGPGVYGQRYDVDGNTIGDEFLINSTTSGDQEAPALSALPDGGFVVTWDSDGQDGSDEGVFGQLYDADGNTVGSEFQVNTYTDTDQRFSSVAGLLDGGFVAAWQSYPHQDGSYHGIYGQLYDANGNAVGSEFRVNTTTRNSQINASVTGLMDGGFVVTWHSDSGSGTDVYGQLYDARGNQVGNEFEVNTHTLSNQNVPTVTALANGGFIVVWQSTLHDAASAGVYGQIFDVDGNSVSTEFLVNTTALLDQRAPSVSSLDDGGFVVSWTSESVDGGTKTANIRGQRFDADGNAIGSEFLVNTYTTGSQGESDIAGFATVIGNGNAIVDIDENSGVNQMVYTANATDTLDTDDDTDNSDAVTYILSGTDADHFSLGATSGELTLLEDPDYETQSSYEVEITATDDSGNSSSQTVTIAVNDLDEVAPVFTSGTTATAVDENGAATVVYTATSDDADATYTLGGTDAASFSIADGVVTFNGSADYETQSSYLFTVTAEDAAGNTSAQNVTMAVNDLDEVAPVFTSGTTATAVDENGAATVVYTATSDDANATYTLGGTDAVSFSIANGVVTFNGSADYETQSSYSFTVTATDAAGNSTDQTVTMAVNDLDEVAPVFTSGATATAVDENGAATVVYTATSDDANATYTLGGTDAAFFSIADGVVTFNGSADYETQPSYSFTVTATDAAGNSTDQTVTMAVNDLDEVAPVFTSGTTATAVDENGTATVVYTATSDDANATYTLGGTDAASFSITDGVVTFNGSADYETQSSYSFTVTATDAAGNSTDQTVTIAVNDLDEVAPVFTSGATATAVDENGAATVVYTATSDDANATYTLGGTDATSFSIANGVVTFNGSADYETQSSYSFTVTAEDAAGNTSTQNVTMAVNDLDEVAPVFTSGTTATAVDENGAATVVYTATSDDANATYTLGGTDAAAFSIADGVVTFNGSADYETQSSYSFTVTAEDAAGNSSDQIVTMAVNDLDEVAPVFTSGATATAVDENGAATVVYTATSDDANATYTLGGTDAASFSIANGIVTFNGSADYETQSSYSFIVTAEDAAGNTSTQTVTMAVNDLDEVVPTASLQLVAGGELATVQLEALNNTTGDDESPQITAVGSEGAYVVTWFGIDSDGDQSIFVQAFNADGGLNGTTQQLEALNETTGDDYAPQITSVGSEGAYVVTWHGNDSGKANNRIFVQAFNSDGSPNGTTVQLEAFTNTSVSNLYPQITAVGSEGGYVVTWHGLSHVDASIHGDVSILVQAFNADGSLNGAMVQLEALNNTDGSDVYPQITAVGDDGAYAVTWYGTDSEGDNSIFVQAVNADGSLNGAMVQLEAPNNSSGADEDPQIIAVGSEGAYVVTWSGLDSDGDKNIFVQAFNVNGSLNGATMQLEAESRISGYDNYEPQITSVGALGDYVVTWYARDSDWDFSIFVQAFNADGSLNGTTVQLAALNINGYSNYDPQITAVGSDGAYVVTWWARDTDWDYSIFVQAFNADGSLNGNTQQLEAVNNFSGTDKEPQISAVGNDGAYVVTWYGIDSEGDYSIFVQAFNADGTPVTNGDGEYLVGDSVDISSTENGTVYLVSSTLVVTSLTDITNATTDLWVSAELTTADGTVALDSTGLQGGTYYAYAVDAAGNLSLASSESVTLQVPDTTAPAFTSGTTATAVDENGAATVVYTATSDDANATYTLGGTDAAAFSITDGVVTFNGGADYETQSSYSFIVTATDAAGNSTDQTVTMAVNDLDEVAPVFTSGTTATAVDENGAATVVYTATSDDANATYTLGGTDAASFSITDGVVTFNGSADYETQSSYSFTVTATDAAGNSSDQTVTMAVNDLDEVAPVFTSGTTATAVDENGAATVVYTATSDDANATYTLGGTDAAFFSIADGVVTFNGSADYETQPSYSFTVTATDAAGNSTDQTVTMAVNDLDEVAPVFTSGTTATAVDENGTATVVYTATSDDANATYTLGGTDAASFSITDGVVTFNGSADYETQSSYSFTVTATDAAGNSSDQTVTMAVNDVDEVQPIAWDAVVAENSGANQAVYTFLVTDYGDTSGGLSYSIKAGEGDADKFSIDSSTGVLTLLDDPDFESQSGYSVTLVASDGVNADVEKSVSIGVLDVAETAVVFDTTTGNSSDISGRAFEADTSYNIYVLMDSDATTPAMSQAWTGGENLGADDRLVFVGDEGNIHNASGTGEDVSAITTSGSTELFEVDGETAFSFENEGEFTRMTDSGSELVDLWSGTANLPGSTAESATLDQLPASVEWETLS